MFRNRKKGNRGIINECNNFCEQAELEEYSVYSFYSISESGIAGIVVIDLDGL